jgi:citrate lyase subunit gamma (acyl carrier protein)
MGKIIQRATAGTLESSDVLVTLEPAQEGLEIELDSVVQNQFGDTILETVQEVLKELDVQDAKISIVDRGALDCVIRARVETALLRGGEKA